MKASPTVTDIVPDSEGGQCVCSRALTLYLTVRVVSVCAQELGDSGFQSAKHTTNTAYRM